MISSCWNLTGLFGLLLVSGCAEKVVDPCSPRQDPICDYPQITVRDGLDHILVVDSNGIVREEGPPLTVTVPVRARSEKDVEVDYRFWFLNKNRKPLDNNPIWHHLLMPAQTQTFVSGTALDRAEDWRLEIRRARHSK